MLYWQPAHVWLQSCFANHIQTLSEIECARTRSMPFLLAKPRIGHSAVTTLGYPIVTHLGRAMQRINVILEHFQSLAIINLHWRWQRTGFGWAQFGFGRMSSYRVGSGSRNRLRRRPNICQPNIFRVVQKIETLTTMCVPTC
jgi:hypothetical protein